MAGRSGLEAAFAATTYVVRPASGLAGGPELRLRIGRAEPGLDAWLRAIGCPGAVVITAHNPGGQRVTDAANSRAEAELLRAAGTDVLAMTVAEPDDAAWPAEPGVLVRAADGHAMAAALGLAERFGQAAAVVLAEGRAPELVWLGAAGVCET